MSNIFGSRAKSGPVSTPDGTDSTLDMLEEQDVRPAKATEEESTLDMLLEEEDSTLDMLFPELDVPRNSSLPIIKLPTASPKQRVKNPDGYLIPINIGSKKLASETEKPATGGKRSELSSRTTQMGEATPTSTSTPTPKLLQKQQQTAQEQKVKEAPRAQTKVAAAQERQSEPASVAVSEGEQRLLDFYKRKGSNTSASVCWLIFVGRS